jgi:hypothetical protein
LDCNTQRIDLHIHSTASDGTLTPKEIAALAVRQGLKAIALTDHDSMEGIKGLLQDGPPEGIELLSGVEISAAPPPALDLAGSLHLLGYGMDVMDPALNQTLEAQQAARINRTPAMIARLDELGITVSLADIREQTGASQIGRPHIARWLFEEGLVQSMDEAFDRYLGRGRPAYVEKPRVPVSRAIEEIRTAGGVAVLAHPGLIALSGPQDYEKLVVELMSMGLQGIEVLYPQHSPEERVFFEKMAGRLGLLTTGGSDFHGDPASEIRLGCGKGDLCVPDRLYEGIAEKLKLMVA